MHGIINFNIYSLRYMLFNRLYWRNHNILLLILHSGIFFRDNEKLATFGMRISNESLSLNFFASTNAFIHYDENTSTDNPLCLAGIHFPSNPSLSLLVLITQSFFEKLNILFKYICKITIKRLLLTHHRI